MQVGEKLIDAKGQETPFVIQEQLVSGERYQIVLATREPEGQKVVLRAIYYGEEDDIDERRAQFQKEWQFLEDVGADGLLPEAVAWVEAGQSPVERQSEPVMVVDYVEGRNLYEWVLEEHPDGVEPEKLLTMVSNLGRLLAKAHRAKWLWRDFDPRRFLVTNDGELKAVSFGGLVRLKAPIGAAQEGVNDTYVAPEIRDEVTGFMQRPAADLYGLGALMAFLATGEEPRERVESPLSFSAFEQLQSWELPGLELLIAKLLQPLAKNRIARAERLERFLTIEGLPTKEERGFEMIMLPAPWLGLEMENPQENRALRSKLSAGPLVSVPREEMEQEPVDAERAAPPAQALNWPVIIGLVLFVAAALVFALLFRP